MAAIMIIDKGEGCIGDFGSDDLVRGEDMYEWGCLW